MEPTVVPEVVRRFAMGFFFLTHIQFAAFFIGIFTLGVLAEFFWVTSPANPFLERMAYGLAKVSAIGYSTGAVLAFTVIILGATFWPVFWDTILRITFWPFIMEAFTFVLTILYLFPWFFTWASLAGPYRWVHLSLGAALLISVYAQQSLIDIVAGYMLTPVPAPLFLRVFFNPTAVPLDVHRVVGDISFAGYVIAGYAAFRMLRSRGEEGRKFHDWLGSIGLTAGLGFLILQPAVGIEYMIEIRMHSPGAFNTMMRGENSWLFLIQVTFLSILFLLSMLYIALQVGKGNGPARRSLWVLFGVAVLGSLLLVNPVVIGPDQQYMWINWVNPAGTMQPWKYIAFGVQTLVAFVALMIFVGAFRRRLPWGSLLHGGRPAQYVLLALAVLSSGMMLLMGYIRENSRLPYLIYYEQRLDQPEQFPNIEATPGPATQPAP